jgi:Domain of Unknown Function (DUF1206)
MSVQTRIDAGSAVGRNRPGKLFEALARAGLVARGVLYGMLGVLAILLATHSTRTPTDQTGAMQAIDRQPFGHGLLVAVAIGLGGYALWRFLQAVAGQGPEGGGDHSTTGRIAAAASGCVYAVLCALAVSILVGSSSNTSSSPHRSTAGVLGWPGGRWVVGAAALILLGIAAYQGFKGLSRRFLKEDKTEQMGPRATRLLTVLGVAGHLARALAFGLVAVFLLKAAIDYSPSNAVGLDGALNKLNHEPYGPVLICIFGAGLVAFAAYSIVDARYRRV